MRKKAYKDELAAEGHTANRKQTSNLNLDFMIPKLHPYSLHYTFLLLSVFREVTVKSPLNPIQCKGNYPQDYFTPAA